MLRKAVLAAAVAALVTSASLAFAASPGTYTGQSDDMEAVTVKVSGNGKEVTLFKVDQGMDCGVTKLTKDVKIKDDGSFVMKQKIVGNVIFKVKGSFPEPGVAQGSYTQVACDGQKDTWNALAPPI